MANPNRGEVALEVAGAGPDQPARRYVLVFSINAMCEVEYVLGKSTDQILLDLAASPPFHVVRALLWGALRERHPEMNLKAVGELMEAIGGPGVALDKVGEGLIAAFPDAAAEGDKPRPRKGAAVGRGRRS